MNSLPDRRNKGGGRSICHRGRREIQELPTFSLKVRHTESFWGESEECKECLLYTMISAYSSNEVCNPLVLTSTHYELFEAKTVFTAQSTRRSWNMAGASRPYHTKYIFWTAIAQAITVQSSPYIALPQCLNPNQEQPSHSRSGSLIENDKIKLYIKPEVVP